jgi:Ribonuclease E/G family
VGETRQALLDDAGKPVDLRLERRLDKDARLTLGDQVSVRIRSLQPAQGGAFVQTGNKAEAFLRLSAEHGLTEGQEIDVMVMAEARRDKLARVSLKGAKGNVPGYRSWDGITVEDVQIGDERVEAAFDEALSDSVVIPNGGRLNIDRTRALTAVDIDSAGRSSKGSAASRALQLNLDASQALARQVRLRKLGGLVILDCIAPLNAGSRQKIQGNMKVRLENLDLKTATVLAPSQLGLMEMSLPWRETPLDERLLDGDGRFTDESQCLAGLRSLEREATRSPMDKLTLELPQGAAAWLKGRGAPLMALLSEKYGHRFSYLASTKAEPIVYQAA